MSLTPKILIVFSSSRFYIPTSQSSPTLSPFQSHNSFTYKAFQLLTPNLSSSLAPHLPQPKPFLNFTSPSHSSPSLASHLLHPKPFLTFTSPSTSSPQTLPHLHQPLTSLTLTTFSPQALPRLPAPHLRHLTAPQPPLASTRCPHSRHPSQTKLPQPPLPAPGSPPAPGTCSVRRRGEAAAPGRAGGMREGRREGTRSLTAARARRHRAAAAALYRVLGNRHPLPLPLPPPPAPGVMNMQRERRGLPGVREVWIMNMYQEAWRPSGCGRVFMNI